MFCFKSLPDLQGDYMYLFVVVIALKKKRSVVDDLFRVGIIYTSWFLKNSDA